MAFAYRTVFAVVGWLALALQYGLMISGPNAGAVLDRTVNFFSFFTILTNLLVALALTLPVVAAGTRPGRWAAAEGVRAAVAMYAAVVGLIYHFLLHGTWSPQGLSLLANVLLHYVMPIAFLLDWLVFTPKGRLRWADPVKWLAFPLIYALWTLIHGALTGWYPYWFVNVAELGLSRVAFNFGGILLVFLVIGCGVVAIDRAFGRTSRRDSTAASA